MRSTATRVPNRFKAGIPREDHCYCLQNLRHYIALLGRKRHRIQAIIHSRKLVANLS